MGNSHNLRPEDVYAAGDDIKNEVTFSRLDDGTKLPSHLVLSRFTAILLYWGRSINCMSKMNDSFQIFQLVNN